MVARSICAVVLATQHDWPTRFVFDAASEAHRLLDCHFSTLPLLPFDPSNTDLFVELFAAQGPRAEGSKPEFVFGYFSAHGSEKSLFAGEHQVFEETTSKLFNRAIFVMTSCLKNGQLAESMVRNNESVHGVIGYTQMLLIPAEDATRQWLADGFTDFQQRFCNALVQPVKSLLESGATLSNAYEDTLKVWSDLVTDTSLPARIRSIAGSNALRLDCWPDRTASVSAFG